MSYEFTNACVNFAPARKGHYLQIDRGCLSVAMEPSKIKVLTEVQLPDRGLKRVCTGCQTKFYDFNKSPVICPKCKTEFTGIVKIRTRRGRNVIEDAKAKAAAAAEEAAPEVEEEERTTVSLEEVAEDEAKAVDGEEEEVGDLDLDDLDDEEEKDDEDLEDIDEEIAVVEKE
jgi:uncharacterized protein (TIGR02300 family)